MKLGVATPWATDANEQSITTHYETDGTSLTQLIEHTFTENVAYPVTADPIWMPIVWAAVRCGLSMGLAYAAANGNLTINGWLAACLGGILGGRFW